MTPTKHISASAVILAAGHSRRMASDKAWLEHHQGGTLIGRQLALLRELGPAEIFISGRPEQNFGKLGCPILLDNFPGAGPLGGIERALEVASAPLVLVLAVDMPAITAAFFRQLYARCTPRVGAVPQLPDRLQPLAAFYPKSAHSTALRLLGEGQNSASGFARFCAELGLVSLLEVASAAHQFTNWNHPSDLPAGTPSR